LNGRDVALLAVLVGAVAIAAYNRWESGKSPYAKRSYSKCWGCRIGPRTPLRQHFGCWYSKRTLRL